jgi:hypothetical protein
MWDHLNATYGASDAGKELYIIESFNNYKMVANKSVVEQAHGIQRLAKELELLKCVLPAFFMEEFRHKSQTQRDRKYQLKT